MRFITIIILLHVTLLAKDITVKQLFNVQTTKVKKITTSQNEKYYGYVKKDESNIYDVTPRFSGYIENLKADKIYKYVKKGELLATVYSPEVLRAKEEYLSTLNYVQKIPSPAMLESSKEKLLLLGVAKEEVDAIKASHQVSKDTNIYAPQSGYIFEKNVVNGSSFLSREKIFEIVNTDTLWIEIGVYQKDMNLISQLNTFKVSTPVGDFNAKKEQLYPSLDEKEALSTLRLSVQNKGGALKPGMYVTVTADVKQQSYLTLPSTAVIFKNAKYYVFVAGDYEGEYTPEVIEAKELDSHTYIVKGLKEGETVVNNALFMMDSDAQINGLY